MTNISKFNVNIKNAKKKVVADYTVNSYPVYIDSYTSENYEIKIKKSQLKERANKIDIRNCKIVISGKAAHSSL